MLEIQEAIISFKWVQVRGHSFFNTLCAPSKQKVFGPFIFAEGTVAGEAITHADTDHSF